MGHGASQVLGGLLEAGAGALVLSGSVLAEAPTLGAATVGVIGGSLLVSDGLDRVIAGFQELTTGRVRDTALDEIAKYFGGDSAAYALNELREQSELYALTIGIGMVASPRSGSPNRSPDPATKMAARESGQLRDPKTGRFIPDPANPPSPNVMTDAQRRANWKRLAQDPTSPLTTAQRAEIKTRGWRGPQRLNEFGELETMELSHEPIPLLKGGKKVVPRWPADHAAIDPHRQLKKRS
jgi:hypothetical protein